MMWTIRHTQVQVKHHSETHHSQVKHHSETHHSQVKKQSENHLTLQQEKIHTEPVNILLLRLLSSRQT